MGSSGVGLSTALPVEAGATSAAGAGAAPGPYNHVHPRATWAPSDRGYIAETYDSAVPSSSSAPANGVLQLARLHVPNDVTITNIVMHIVTGADTPVTGQSFAVLYTAAGAKVGITADQAAAWDTSGFQTMPLVTPYAAAKGDYYVGWWSVGATAALAFLRAGNTVAVNAGLAAPNLRFATANTGLTTTAPDPFGAQTAANIGWWVGLS